MSLKQILSSTLLLSSSLLARADYGYGSSGSSSSVDSSGSGGYGSGSGSGSYGSGSSSNGGYGSGSGSGSHGNQGYQSSSTMDSGMGGKGGMGDSHSTTYGQNTQIETISVTETMMMTMTVTESVCSTQAMATYSPPMGGGPPPMSGSGGSWGSSGSSGSSTSVSVQIVTVSDNTGALSYFPNSVVAAVGSIVEFHYYPKNHTVTQSSFAAPCVPINVSTPNMTTPGIKSGFVPVAANDTEFMRGIRASFSVMINDTKPIWIYCGQVGHCQKGMSMVINQNMNDPVKTLANYQAAAMMLPVMNGTMTMPPPGIGGAPPEQSTSTSTFTAAAFPPPSAPTQPPPVVTQQPPSPVTTSAAPVAQLTSTAPSVATFTGAAVALSSNKLSAAAGVIAMGVAALL